MVAHVKKDTFRAEVVDAGVPVLVDFYANWCGPCRSLAPILEELDKESNAAFRVVKVDVDTEPDLAQQFGITALPTLLVFQQGEVVHRIVGLEGKEQIRKHLTTAVV